MTDNSFQLPIINVTEDAKHKLVKIELGKLPPNEALLSPAPTRELVEDIAIRGQTTPIQVTVDADGNYIVFAGRRRIKALRMLHEAMPEKWKVINAVVIEASLDAYGILGLSSVENNLRTDNPLTDLQAIRYLMETNPQISEQEISRQTGIPVARIRKRLKLNQLIPELGKAVINNDVNIGTAEEIAKLSPRKQEQLLNTFLEKGKITREDVVVVQRAVVQENADTLPAFPDMEPVAVEETVGYIVVSPDLLIYQKEDEPESFVLDLEEAKKLVKKSKGTLQLCKVVTCN